MNRNQILAASTIVAVTVVASIALFNDSPPPIAEPAPIAQPAVPLVVPDPVEPAPTSTTAAGDYYPGPEPKSVTQLREEMGASRTVENRRESFAEAPADRSNQIRAELNRSEQIGADSSRAAQAQLDSCPSEPLYYPPSDGACFNRDISGEPTGPTSCLKYRSGDTLWRVEFAGRVTWCVTPSRVGSDFAPGYVEWGVPYALMGGARIDPHDPRTVRAEHVNTRTQTTRPFGRAFVGDADIVVAVDQRGRRWESLYVTCGSHCEAKWVYLPTLMDWNLRFEPAKVTR